MPHTFQSLITPPEEALGQPALWFCIGRSTVLVSPTEEGLRPVLATHPRELGLRVSREHFLGFFDGTPCWAASLDEPVDEVEDYRPESLFSLFPNVDSELWTLAGRAVQIAEWDRTSSFCGRCGAATEVSPGERARKCPSCGLLAFPRLAPAVIMLIERDDEALLARGRTFGANPMYSTLAGFVEPGETIEEAVAREVREEVGVELSEIRYMRSQPWPFPNSLMLGFNAKWKSGDINIDPAEIVDAKWFKANDLPNIPGRMSIARWLIDDWLSRVR